MNRLLSEVYIKFTFSYLNMFRSAMESNGKISTQFSSAVTSILEETDISKRNLLFVMESMLPEYTVFLTLILQVNKLGFIAPD